MHSVQLSLRSGGRDPAAYPDTNDYRVDLAAPLQRVVDIRLMTAEMTSSQLTVEAGYNDALRYDDGIRVDPGAAPRPLAPPFDGIEIWANQCVVHERDSNLAAVVTMPPHAVEIEADAHGGAPPAGIGATPYRTAAPHGGVAALVAGVPAQPPLSAEDLVFAEGTSLVQAQLEARRTGASLPVAPRAEDETRAFRLGQSSRLATRAEAHGGVLHHPALLPSSFAASMQAQLERAQQRGHLRHRYELAVVYEDEAPRLRLRCSGRDAVILVGDPRNFQQMGIAHGMRLGPEPRTVPIAAGYEVRVPAGAYDSAGLLGAVDAALNGGLALTAEAAVVFYDTTGTRHQISLLPGQYDGARLAAGVAARMGFVDRGGATYAGTVEADGRFAFTGTNAGRGAVFAMQATVYPCPLGLVAQVVRSVAGVVRGVDPVTLAAAPRRPRAIIAATEAVPRQKRVALQAHEPAPIGTTVAGGNLTVANCQPQSFEVDLRVGRYAADVSGASQITAPLSIPADVGDVLGVRVGGAVQYVVVEAQLAGTGETSAETPSAAQALDGRVAVTQGSTTITGVGTAFDRQVPVPASGAAPRVRIEDVGIFTVAAVVDESTMAVLEPAAATTAGKQAALVQSQEQATTTVVDGTHVRVRGRLSVADGTPIEALWHATPPQLLVYPTRLARDRLGFTQVRQASGGAVPRLVGDTQMQLGDVPYVLFCLRGISASGTSMHVYPRVPGDADEQDVAILGKVILGNGQILLREQHMNLSLSEFGSLHHVHVVLLNPDKSPYRTHQSPNSFTLGITMDRTETPFDAGRATSYNLYQ